MKVEGKQMQRILLIKRELSEDNLSGEKDKYSRYLPLLKATLRGDWNTAKEFFEKDENAITVPITAELETALYMDTGTGPKAVHFVEELLKLMPAEALLQKDNAGNTPLHFGAWVGNSKATRLLVKKNPALLSIPSEPVLLPVHYAAMSTEKRTLSYLWKETKKDAAAVSVLFSSGSEGLGAELLINVITSGFYDVALDLVHLYPKLATSRSRNGNDYGLKAIARKVSAFRSGRHKNFWDGILYPHHPGLLLVTKRLDGNNYATWRCSIVIALTAKNKIGFVTGAIEAPNAAKKPVDYALWERCDKMVLSWLLNSVETDLADGVVYVETAQEIWGDFHDRFS